MKIYIAGPSKELPRIVALRDALIAAGHTVTSRWIDIILAEGSEHAAALTITDERLMECAAINEADIVAAEMMVYVVEHNNGKSVGAGYELGFQARTCRDRIVVFAELYPVGLTNKEGQPLMTAPRPTLFALALHTVDTLDKLLGYLEGWETSAKTHVEAMSVGEPPPDDPRCACGYGKQSWSDTCARCGRTPPMCAVFGCGQPLRDTPSGTVCTAGHGF